MFKKKNIAIILTILLIVVAIGGVYAYRVHNINQKRDAALKQIEAFDTSKYDGDELDAVNNLVNDAKAKLEDSKDPEKFDSIVSEFNAGTKGIKTTAQKEEERKALNCQINCNEID